MIGYSYSAPFFPPGCGRHPPPSYDGPTYSCPLLVLLLLPPPPPCIYTQAIGINPRKYETMLRKVWDFTAAYGLDKEKGRWWWW